MTGEVCLSMVSYGAKYGSCFIIQNNNPVPTTLISVVLLENEKLELSIVKKAFIIQKLVGGKTHTIEFDLVNTIGQYRNS